MHKVKNIPDDQLQLLSDLQSLLRRQIELSHHGNLSGVEKLFKRTDHLVEKIARGGILQRPELQERREQLERLYEALRLTVAAQREEASNTLNAIRWGKKILKTYGNYMS